MHFDIEKATTPIGELHISAHVYDRIIEMTKRVKKRIGKKNTDVPQSDGDPQDQPSQLPSEGRRNSGPTVDLTFFRSSAQLYGELHQRLSCLSVDSYTEESVLQTGRQIFQVLNNLADAADTRCDTKSSCPFVMLLSMLLPTLRKYLAWTKATRSIPSSNLASLRHQSMTSDGVIYKSWSDAVLWPMLAQHDVLTRFSLQTTHILRLIESNESIDHDDPNPKPTTYQFKASKTTTGSLASSESSACSSVASTPRDPIDNGISRTPRLSRAKRSAVPQLYRISMELASIDAQCKILLAGLTETIVEVVEMIAKHMCTPTASKDGGKTRLSAREYIERLVQHLLGPMGQRMLAEPSVSNIDLFPRILEQCINVTIDTFARSDGKQNELQAAPFEAGVMHLRTWSFKLEIEYNTLMRSMSNSSNNTDSSTDTDVSDSAAPSTTYAPSTRMNLMALGGFKRLENTLNAWLSAAAAGTAAQDLGSGSSARSWGVSTLAGGLRSTLVRTFSGRATLTSPPM
ncbi:hypothetical protein P3T76_001188 [Phytophthora citrophthora]|uniref:Uncharacterized protein n=1 Tax=Phytophthora citrophthora TaxID=4793 RepID=A0AAD9GZX7_9STRA|nr:hypothetical protein P3T76_001188 [Phytophthora citrophthora]